MQDTLFTERKNIKLNLRLPSRLDQELRRLAEMDCISLNSAIVRLLAKGVREEVTEAICTHARDLQDLKPQTNCESETSEASNLS